MWHDAEKFLLNDRHISPLIKKWGECTIEPTKKTLYFEDLVDAICSQQLSGKAAKTIFGRVKSTLGKVSSDTVLLTKPDILRKCGLSYAKISYIKDLAKKVEDGSLNLNNIEKLLDEDIIGQLVLVKGIGGWTAEMFLMFSLARPDVFPVDDLGIKKGFEKVTGKSWKESEKFAEKYWSPFRTVASWYLWRSLENS
jgi:DNA-3-methyladenine glycosylase II